MEHSQQQNDKATVNAVTQADEDGGGSAAESEDVVLTHEVIDLTNDDDDEADEGAANCELNEARRRSLWSYMEESDDVAVKTEVRDEEKQEQHEKEETKESDQRVVMDEQARGGEATREAAQYQQGDEHQEAAKEQGEAPDEQQGNSEDQQRDLGEEDEADQEANGDKCSEHAIEQPPVPPPRCVCCLTVLDDERVRRIVPCSHVYCLPCIGVRAMVNAGLTCCCSQEFPWELIQEAQRFVGCAPPSERKRKHEDDGNL